MTPIFLDYETFWSVDHSLTKMSPITYVMHPDTEIISVAVKVGGGATEVLFGEDDIREYFDTVDWSDAMVVGHNLSGFDAMIHAWRFGIRPKMWCCTMAMARPLFAKVGGVSLKNVAERLGVGYKDSAALVNTKGKNLKDFTLDELRAMRVYNRDDTEMCAGIFKKLVKHYSTDELRVLDATIRMLVEPRFLVDAELLEQTLTKLREDKQHLLETLSDEFGLALEPDPAEAVRAMLASAPKFSKFLQSHGVEVPMKVSPKTGKPAPALAKTDEAFLALQEHENPLVAAAASARLGVKSTLLETRIEAFLSAAKATGGLLPVPLHYYGADTTGRWSGWAYNPQNLPRISGKPSDALRKSLRAPKGYKVVVADLSGIELRVNMFLWQVPYAMKLFQDSPDKADLYRYFAAKELYLILEAEVTKPQRQVGKVAHLGLGFGAGGPTFQKVAKLMGGVDMSVEEATAVVRTYRAAHPEIARGWKTCHEALEQVFHGVEVEIDPWGLCTTTREGIRTPRGMIRYPHLKREVNDEGKLEWMYGEGRKRTRIYAGKVDENLVQHLARFVVADNMVALLKHPLMRKHPPSLCVHDELVYVVPEEIAEEVLDTVQSVMRTPPDWWPQLVTWSEGDIADTYGDAK